MTNYSINLDIDTFNRIDIKSVSNITDSIVAVLLNNSTNNKLFDYYSSVKELILNRNRVILLIDSLSNSNIDKQISMLMVSYGKYDIYRIEDIKSVDFEYVGGILDREPTREEIEQFIGCDISMYDKINVLLAELYNISNNTTDGVIREYS